MNTGIIRYTFALGAALSFCFAGPALGQQAGTATGDELGLSEIVVTARRVEERLQDVPISITVFNPQQLANFNVVNAQDLAAYTPSLSANSNFGPENSTYAIRGFVQDIGTPPSVGVYFADVVAPRGPTQGVQAGDGAGPGNFFDLQNVQVVKGPQGTLFGRNTTGGAVLFVPQKPTSDLDGYVEVSHGNYDMQHYQGAFNIPLNDVVRFRIALDRETRDGYVTNDSDVGPRTFNNIDYTAVRASLVVDVTPNLENYSIFSYLNSDTNGSIQKLIACNPAESAANFLGLLSCAQLAQQKGTGFYTVQAGDFPDPESKLDQAQIINTTTWKAGDALTFKNIASYAEFRDKLATGLFGTNWQLPTAYGPVNLPFTAVTPIPGGYSSDQFTATEEFQVQGAALDQRLTYQGGVYYETSQPLELSGNQTPNFVSCTNLATLQCTPLFGSSSSVGYTAGDTRFSDIGIYGQSSYSLTDQWKLTLGVRNTWDTTTNTSSRITYIFPATNVSVPICTDSLSATLPTCTENLRQHSSAPTWLLDLDYKPTDDVLLYGKYSRGYRAGGVFPNSPSNYRVFQPEKVDDFELGAKTSFQGPVPGIFNIDTFYNNFRDQQLQVSFDAAAGAPVAPTTGIVNAGKSKIYGVEVETSLSPFRGFNLDFNYTYLRAYITAIAPLVSTDPNYVLVNPVLPGNTLELSPENKYTIMGTYTLPLPTTIGKVSVGATFTHTDQQLTAFAYINTPSLVSAFGSDLGILPPRNLLNLNLNWNSIAGLPLDASLFGTNVSNQHYYTFVPGIGSYGFETAELGEPRMYGVRLRYRFGK